ncbi:hypothetical protein, partial [Thiohalomonas denitrificans]|uniref:hypothetical protein n=1 Tax=Thiohalomonas denitrificans TaxID=415747 RepID=UPI0026F04435
VAGAPRNDSGEGKFIRRSHSDAAIWGLGAGDYFVAQAPRNDSEDKFIRSRTPCAAGDTAINAG